MRPSGATNVRGYNGSARAAVVSWRHAVPFHTSGIVTSTPAVSVPPIVTTSPSGRVVLVGYHRPAAIGGRACQVLVAGSNTLVLGNPWRSLICPPATSKRPSGRKSWPAQNTRDGAGTAENTPVAGSHTWASPYFPQLSTLPVGSRWRCSCTIGAGK